VIICNLFSNGLHAIFLIAPDRFDCLASLTSSPFPESVKTANDSLPFEAAQKPLFNHAPAWMQSSADHAGHFSSLFCRRSPARIRRGLTGAEVDMRICHEAIKSSSAPRRHAAALNKL
jgi:hypothetical protein